MRGYACIGLDNPKSAVNVGSVFRAANCYGAAFVAISGYRAIKNLGRIPSDTPRMGRHKPVLRVDNLKDVTPFDCVPVAVDLIRNAKSLITYNHPQRAFYIFGAEDATLGNRITEWCRDIIYIPTNGCMNLAATVNIILYDRMAKGIKDEQILTHAH